MDKWQHELESSIHWDQGDVLIIDVCGPPLPPPGNLLIYSLYQPFSQNKNALSFLIKTLSTLSIPPQS